MIVRSLESPVFQKRKREPLAGKGAERASNEQKSFEEYLLDAFNGEVVRDGSRFSSKMSDLTRDNLIRLSQS